MKPPQVALLLTASVFVGYTLIASGRPVDLSAPTVEIGSADSMGYLEIWRQIDEVKFQFGSKSFLPLRYEFSTDPHVGGMLGAGFYVPMLEAKSLLIREQMMRAYLPCGKSLYLRRSSKDQNTFETVDAAWKGELAGNYFTVWRDDGWKLVYHNGRLSSAQTDDNHIFTWNYEDNTGLPLGISEDGNPVIGTEYEAGKMSAITFGKARYVLEYANRPMTDELAGQTVVKELDQVLSKLVYPDGKTDSFAFTLTSDLIPKLKYTNRSGIQESYGWDSASNHLVNESGSNGEWTYEVGKIAQDFGQPAIMRTNTKGETQSVVVNNTSGTTTTTESDGEMITKTVFKTPGPLYNKIRNIVDTGKSSVVKLRFNYDQTGRLTRKIDTNGFITEFQYGSDNSIINQKVLPPQDLEILQALRLKQSFLQTSISKESDSDRKDAAIQELAYFDIYQMGDLKSALDLIPKLHNPSRAFSIELHTIVGDPNISRTDLINNLKDLGKSYPENQAEIISLITSYSAR